MQMKYQFETKVKKQLCFLNRLLHRTIQHFIVAEDLINLN